MMDFFTFDADYVRRLCAGDPLIGEHFKVYFQSLLLRKVRRLLRWKDDIDDVIQEVFARVIQSVCVEHALRDLERLGAFVNTVAVNVIHEKGRETRRTSQFAPGFDVAGPDDIEKSFVTHETQAIVRKILGEMALKDAQLLREWFGGRDKDAICAELGVERGYLRVLVHRALKRFGELYRRRKR